MKITSNIIPAGIEYIAMEAMKNKGVIPASLRCQMTQSVIKTVERKVKYFKKHPAEYEAMVAAAKEAAEKAESVAVETPAEVVDAKVEDINVEEVVAEAVESFTEDANTVEAEVVEAE